MQLAHNAFILVADGKKTLFFRNEGDGVFVSVKDGDKNGVLLETVGTFSNLDESPTYIKRRFDVSRYRGATIRIAFKGVQHQGPPTWFLLDDAALNVWR